MFVFIHPHFCQSDRILLDHIDSSLPGVRTALPEYMANMGTGNDLQNATAHPNLHKQSCQFPYIHRKMENSVSALWQIKVALT